MAPTRNRTTLNVIAGPAGIRGHYRQRGHPTVVSVAVGATAFKQLTPGVVSLRPAIATAAAQQAAIARFPLGAGLGSLWYGVYPASPSPLTTIGVTVGLALAFTRAAHGDIGPGQAQHHRLGRFRFTRFGFGLAEQASAQRKVAST